MAFWKKKLNHKLNDEMNKKNWNQLVEKKEKPEIQLNDGDYWSLL